MIERQVTVEKELIHQAKNGDEDAYGVLYQHHLDAIYAYIRKRVTSVSEAEDLAQTVFLKAWQALQNYQPSAIPFRAWLYRIAHNTVIDHYRTEKETTQWEDMAVTADSADTPEGMLLETERRETIRSALATLRPTYRAVITYRFINDKGYEETAKALDRQVNNIRVLQHRALDALRRTLHQQSTLWIALVATAITLLFGTTIVQAATRALPGEKLYPLRTFVEEVRLAVANDATNIRLHAEFANRRVADLQILSGQGQTEAINETVTQFSAHIRLASAKLTELSQTHADASSLATQFDQFLQEQATSLTTLESTTSPALKPSLQPAIESVTAARQKLKEQIIPAPSSTGQQSKTNLPARNQRSRQAIPSITIKATVTPSSAGRLPGSGSLPAKDDAQATPIKPKETAPVFAKLPAENTPDPSNVNNSPLSRADNLSESWPVEEVTPSPMPTGSPADTPAEHPDMTPRPLPEVTPPSQAPSTDVPDAPVEGDQNHATNAPATNEPPSQAQDDASQDSTANTNDSGDHHEEKPHTGTSSDEPDRQRVEKDR